MRAVRQNKNKGAIYREAARLIAVEATNRSCWAVSLAAGHSIATGCPERYRYVRAILGTEATADLFPIRDGIDANGVEALDIRVLALLLMAAIADDDRDASVR